MIKRATAKPRLSPISKSSRLHVGRVREWERSSSRVAGPTHMGAMQSAASHRVSRAQRRISTPTASRYGFADAKKRGTRRLLGPRAPRRATTLRDSLPLGLPFPPCNTLHVIQSSFGYVRMRSSNSASSGVRPLTRSPPRVQRAPLRGRRAADRPCLRRGQRPRQGQRSRVGRQGWSRLRAQPRRGV